MPVYNTNFFLFLVATVRFVTEASTIGFNPVVAFSLESQRTTKKITMHLTQTETSKDGEVIAWHYRNNETKVEATIFNT